MAQTPTVAKLTPSAKQGVLPQARLILQDPLAFDQALQPALRRSTELSTEPAATGLEREKARDLWESLSLEPEVAQERQSERKRLLLRSENLVSESAVAKTQAIELQAQLAKARDERFDHPVVYAGAAGLLGLGALWFFERRKRMALQERELDQWAEISPPSVVKPAAKTNRRANDHVFYDSQQGSTFSLEDSPDLAHDFATDLSGLPEPVVRQTQPTAANASEADNSAALPAATSAATPTPTVVISDLLDTSPALLAKASLPAVDVPLNPAPDAPAFVQQEEGRASSAPEWAQPKGAQSKLEPDLRDEQGDAMRDASWRKPERGLLSMSKRVLGNMLRRRAQREELSAASASQLPTENSSTSHHSTAQPSTLLHEHLDDATQMLYDEEAQEAFEQELLAQQLSAGLHAGYDPHRSNIELLAQTRISPLQGETAMEHLLELRTAASGLCALGRPEAAAKLLEEHIAADPSTCAWAYLEHMHVCEQIGWRDEFEIMRKNYRHQFNRMAPYWHEPNSNVLGLDGYARAAGELCTAWAQGVAYAHNTLASWLIGPLLGRKLVQLPAYHDLFELYEMLEYLDPQSDATHAGSKPIEQAVAFKQSDGLLGAIFSVSPEDMVEQEFVPTVSLLDLDYEFSSDVTLQEKEVQQSETAVTIVKTGNFSVDFNVAGTQMGALSSVTAELAKK